MQYEYMNDWYILPENPEQVTLHPDTYPTYAYKGDGNWSNEIYGGDLKGITKRIDYLKALGVTVIYLNPVFESISSHRYDTSDYKNIDPILGTLGDFEELVSVAEANNMHVVLDGVFNHVSMILFILTVTMSIWKMEPIRSELILTGHMYTMP